MSEPTPKPDTGTLFDVRRQPDRRVVTMVEVWSWMCKICGFVVWQAPSERAAKQEATSHLWDQHALAACPADSSEAIINIKRMMERYQVICSRCGLVAVDLSAQEAHDEQRRHRCLLPPNDSSEI